ncbi:MAG: malate dehydrogenase [Thermoplasmata archaeon HGW-Thermoplasmata-1]|nr:MAG: malate dehydrogenase [Thermoplasmata archaeon HGW-Thermoplasmata-1]
MQETEKVTTDELLKKAEKPSADAMRLHPFYRGKIEVVPKARIRDFNDFAIWYTPGVAKPCMDIHHDVEKSYIHTNRWNSVAVVSDGTRVLGLGDIGPEAAMPVMEGKAMLFKYLGGVDAFPLCIGTKDPDEIIRFVKLIQPTVGGVNLEDIASPKCFSILDRLRSDPEVKIPVWHDDQQGTATVVVAGAMNALKLVGKKMREAKVCVVGAGAASVAIVRLLTKAGITKKNIIMADSRGILHPARKDLEARSEENPYKWKLCLETNEDRVIGSVDDAFRGADLCVAASAPGPGTIKPEWVSKMASDSIMFATANPIPEIWPWEAKEAGCRIFATGRSDFPNQVNNSLGFPAIFRGTLDVRAATITDEMCIAAAGELAKVAEDNGLSETYIIPKMDEWDVFPREAVAVGMKAMEQGIARLKPSRQELYEQAEAMISRSRGLTKCMMEKGFIEPAPEE